MQQNHVIVSKHLLLFTGSVEVHYKHYMKLAPSKILLMLFINIQT